MTRRVLSGNIGEWSEIYAFLKILYDGIIYAADENANKITNVFLEVLKVVRKESSINQLEYRCGEQIQIWRDNFQLAEIDRDSLIFYANQVYNSFFNGRVQRNGSFVIDEVQDFLDLILVSKLRAPSAEKVDISMQVYDARSGQKPTVGFSIKSDVGALPTLLNSGKNTKFRYKINGMNDDLMLEINSLTDGNYLVKRMRLLFQEGISVVYSSMNSVVFEQNLTLIDMRMPEIYAEMILIHYRSTKFSNCTDIVEKLIEQNPLDVGNLNLYKYKFKKLLIASALGMTPGTIWDGSESATGGYLIVKNDGEVLYYHLHNRNSFEEYLLQNTKFDRPGMNRYNYGYIFKIQDSYFIDFNIQIRFRSNRHR
jgi:hypothetical protein